MSKKILISGLFFLLILQSCYNNKLIFEKESESKIVLYNVQLGFAYLNNGEILRAKHKIITALQFAPNSVEANTAMAYFLEKTENQGEAEKYYRKAISLKSAGAQFNNYGTYLCRQQKYRDAEKYFLLAVADLYYLGTAMAYENAGLCLVAVDSIKAQKYFAKALANDPSRKKSLFSWIDLELKQNNFVKVLQILNDHQFLACTEPELVKIGMKLAQKIGDHRLAANYKLKLDKLS